MDKAAPVVSSADGRCRGAGVEGTHPSALPGSAEPATVFRRPAQPSAGRGTSRTITDLLAGVLLTSAVDSSGTSTFVSG